MAAIPSVLAIVEGIGSSESPAQAVAVTTRGGAPVGVAHVRGQGRHDGGRRRPAPRPVGPGVVGRLATRGRVPLGYYKDPGAQRAHVRRDRRRALVAAGRHGDDRRRRHDPPARPRLAVHQHRRREGVPRGGRGRAEAPPRGRATRSCSARPTSASASGSSRSSRPTAGAPRPTSTTLQAHCRAHLAGYKVPRALHVVAEIPRSPAGKADYAWARCRRPASD